MSCLPVRGFLLVAGNGPRGAFTPQAWAAATLLGSALSLGAPALVPGEKEERAEGRAAGLETAGEGAVNLPEALGWEPVYHSGRGGLWLSSDSQRHSKPEGGGSAAAPRPCPLRTSREGFSRQGGRAGAREALGLCPENFPPEP